MADDATSRAIASGRSRAPDEAGLYVVGIGASAGGLGALRTLFSTMPDKPGFACVIVVHLSPQHESHFVELLQPYTRLRVQQVTRTVALEPNNVYVIPPNANLDTIDTHLRLSRLEARRVERAPIDHFLRTLAATHAGRAIGVVLTGTGSAGSLGLRQIKERGGLTIAQEPGEAEYDTMPRNAIATGMVDLVLPLAEIAEQVTKFCATQPQLRIAQEAEREEEGTDEERNRTQQVALDEIVAELENRTDRDFKFYRRTPMLRRIRRRMQLRHVETLEDYFELMRDQSDEATALCNDLVLTVSEFFHDPDVFDQLEMSVVPRLLAIKHRSSDKLRVWSVGCSTGEEAYSLAMLLLEQASPDRPRPHMQVFASDLSAEMLGRAREGLYPHEVAATVSNERLQRFFVEEMGCYRVSQAVRGLVMFAEHNLFRDPPYAHLDLIVCRNLLSDLQPEMRSAVLGLFHYALEPHGVLVTSPQDRVELPSLFEPDGRHPWLLRRIEGPSRPRAWPSTWRQGHAHPLTLVERNEPRGGVELAAVHHRMMDRYIPSSVLLDASNTVVYYSTSAGRYLRLPGGELTHDVFALMREPLKSVLRPLLDRARAEHLRQQSDGLTIDTPHGAKQVVVHVEPPIPDGNELTLVVFEELAARGRKELNQDIAVTSAHTVAQLYHQIDAMERRVRALVETGVEDKKDADETNEKLASANVELKFLLEALESSKEELQAANEELTALDRENRHRLFELGRLSGDLRNLLESTGIATLFLDRELKIVRFTPQLGELFNVVLADAGRPLADITHGLLYDDLALDAMRALDHTTTVEREVPSRGGRWYLTRILPYRTPSERVDGVVITLVDITDRKRVEDELKAADRRKDEFLALLAHELRNPLAPISSGIEVLKRGTGDKEIVAQITATMARQAKQLVRLVDDLLDLSRVSGARLQLRKSRVRLRDGVRDAVAAVKPLIDRSRHELTVSIADETLELDADSARLTQIVANLLTNAARYTPDGGKIEIKAERRGTSAVITVADNGIGIAPESLERVFEMFYQGDDPRLPRAAGLGIGLTLAKSLVEMHGGTIDVQSAGADQGSRFTVRLPIAEAGQPDAQRAEPKRASELGGHRVLIVDDNTDAARTLGMLVEALGKNQVSTAANGPEALRLAEELRPDIVLLDLKMPGMDGYEVARLLRRESWGKDMMLVAVTGWALEEHRRRSKEAGFDRHLTKPADIASLEALLAGAFAPAQTVN